MTVAFDINDPLLPTPCTVCDEAALARNLNILDGVQRRAGCKILLALKAFAMFSLFPRIRGVLAGTSASSLNEARLGAEEFGKELHVCAPAYRDAEFPHLARLADHLVFNSFSQWERFKPRIPSSARRPFCGIRINPEHSEVRTALYDPCRPGSRLGVRRADFEGRDLDGISGLHFHTLCELNADALGRTLNAVRRAFDPYLRRMTWVNFGGGHQITRGNYDTDGLCRLIREFREHYGLKEVYLEPGEAVVLDAGVLVTSVLDIVHNEVDIAILDTSAAAHMPDVLEMPYRPHIAGAGPPGRYPHTYRLGGLTCLAGDVIGDYSFPDPLRIGSRLALLDMAHYTMVKSNTFNGVGLPAIAIREERGGALRIVREFGYDEYRARLS